MSKASITDLVDEIDMDLLKKLGTKLIVFKSIVAEANGELSSAIQWQQGVVEKHKQMDSPPIALSEACVRLARLNLKFGSREDAILAAEAASRAMSEVLKLKNRGATAEQKRAEMLVLGQLADLFQV